MNLLIMLFLSLSGTLGAQKPGITRALMIPTERSFDQRLTRLNADDPFDVIGLTRSVYLDGYGVVFTTEVNLLVTPGMTPFRPAITKEERAQVRAKKMERLGKLKELMRSMLVDAAHSLDPVPANEQVALGVNLMYLSWEDRSGLPAQVLMQGQRKALLTSRAAAIQEREY